MKKRILMTAVLIFMALGAGCSKGENTQSEKQTLVVNGSEEHMQTDETESIDNNDITSETTAPDMTSAETETADNASTQDNAYTQAADEQSAGIYQGGASGGGNASAGAEDLPVQLPSEEMAEGTNGRTESEWLEIAQPLYKEGCDIAFRYLCTGSEFPFDRANLEIIDKTYFLTTCGSFDDATKQYYELFDREYHKNDFDGLLLEQGGRLYAARAARGMDMTYLSSEVEKLVSVSDNEVVFSVLVEYEDGSTEMEFSIIPDGDSWKIGKFTLPY